MIELIERASAFRERTAIQSNDQRYTYGQLLKASEHAGIRFLDGKRDLNGIRIAYLVPPGFDHVSVQWGIWRAGGIAVPLYEKHPLSAIQYIIDDAGISTLAFSTEFESLLTPLFDRSDIQFVQTEEIGAQQGSFPDIQPDRNALIVYTSGSTGAPKGVVTTHNNIQHQIGVLTDSWAWNKNDHILNVLPLHHVHGIINVLGCALWSGACCEFLPKFSAGAVFDIFGKQEVNVFMAVPTIYFKLITYYNQLPASEQQKISQCLQAFRLMVSGSAALPASMLKQWKQISGHTLLERYGMTEVGMAISNPYRGERKPGCVGQPLPGAEIRLVDETNTPVAVGLPGEIQVKGANVFKEYWNKPEETSGAFTPDGWFKSGDIAVFEDGGYKILGRSSVDIIKSGGYKISGLEIEEMLRTHPKINDCGVVGIPDEEWGEVICACLVVESALFDIEQLNKWLKEKLPGYKTPRKYLLLQELPRNAMGKVTKRELKQMFMKG